MLIAFYFLSAMGKTPAEILGCPCTWINEFM